MITKENGFLVLRIPLKQNQYEAYGEVVGEVENIIGLVDLNNCSYTISNLIDMSYKGKAPQIGSPIICFDTIEELKEVCEKIGLNIIYMSTNEI